MVSRVPFTNRQKKERSHPLPARTHHPLAEGSNNRVTEIIPRVVAVTTNDYWGQQTKKKQRSHLSFDAFIPLRMMPLCRRNKPAAIGRTAHQRLLVRPPRHLCCDQRHHRGTPQTNPYGVRPACVVHLFAGVSRRNGFPRELL